MISLPAIDRLCDLSDPYQHDAESERLFDEAMTESVLFHIKHSPGYEKWLKINGITADQLPLKNWGELPPIFANYFKKRLLLSDTGQDALELTSSGTSGQKSRMRYDERTVKAGHAMIDRIFDLYGWNTPDQPCNYLLLSYEPAGTISLGTSYTAQFICKYAPVNRAVYALRHTGSGHEFDFYGSVAALQSFAEEGLPVRILGFPAFMWFILERMHQSGLPPLKLHSDSFAFFGGGWKSHADKEISKFTLYDRMHEQLGMQTVRCRDGYGAVEHCIPYIECPNHQFHVPVYAKAFIRDTATYELLPYGERGFLQFVSPYITSSPAHSILMSDLATLHPGKECRCGLETDWFELHGRASQQKARNCALAASELIKG